MTVPAAVREAVARDLKQTTDTHAVIATRHGISLETMWKIARAAARDDPEVTSGHVRRKELRMRRAAAIAARLRDPACNVGLREIANELGMTLDTAQRLMHDWRIANGVTMAASKPLSEDERARARHLLACGQSPQNVARELRVPVSYILDQWQRKAATQ